MIRRRATLLLVLVLSPACRLSERGRRLDACLDARVESAVAWDKVTSASVGYAMFLAGDVSEGYRRRAVTAIALGRESAQIARLEPLATMLAAKAFEVPTELAFLGVRPEALQRVDVAVREAHARTDEMWSRCRLACRDLRCTGDARAPFSPAFSQGLADDEGPRDARASTQEQQREAEQPEAHRSEPRWRPPPPAPVAAPAPVAPPTPVAPPAPSVAPASAPPPVEVGLYHLQGSAEMLPTWVCASGAHAFRGVRLRGWRVTVTGRCELVLTDCDFEGATRAALVTVNSRASLTLERTRVVATGSDGWAVGVSDQGDVTVHGGELRANDMALWADDRARVTLDGASLRGQPALSVAGRARVTARASSFAGQVLTSRRARLRDDGSNTGLSVAP